MIGKKSIVKKIWVKNNANPKENFCVLCQLDKNHGICDVTLVTPVTKEHTKEMIGGGGKPFTKKYKTTTYVPIKRLPSVLSMYQGQPGFHPDVQSAVKWECYDILNPEN